MCPESPVEDIMASDAIALLSAEQTALIRLFSDYERLVAAGGSADDRQAFARHIGRQSTVYIRLRDDWMQRAARPDLEDKHLLELAAVNRDDAEALVEDISSMSPDAPIFDAWVALLGCCLRHLVELDQIAIDGESPAIVDVGPFGTSPQPRWARVRNA
jgi:hypothetical protein